MDSGKDCETGSGKAGGMGLSKICDMDSGKACGTGSGKACGMDSGKARGMFHSPISDGDWLGVVLEVVGSNVLFFDKVLCTRRV